MCVWEGEFSHNREEMSTQQREVSQLTREKFNHPSFAVAYIGKFLAHLLLNWRHVKIIKCNIVSLLRDFFPLINSQCNAHLQIAVSVSRKVLTG